MDTPFQKIQWSFTVSGACNWFFLASDFLMCDTNVRQMLRDPTVYENPEHFNPDRFMGDHPEPDPRAIVFGFGRRACPGRYLVEASLQITAAMLVHSFEFKPIEVNGKPVPLECRSLKGGAVK
jgi:hypothetical protein